MGDSDVHSGIMVMAAQVQSLLSEVRENSIALAAHSQDLRTVKDYVTGLMKLVKEGELDGRPSLIMRIGFMERMIDDIEKKHLKSIHESLECINDGLGEVTSKVKSQADAREDRRESRAHKLQLWGTVITAIVALLLGIFK